jgi:UDP-N-acetylglucosamine-peptide-n-acetylglucosaminyltransferase
MNKENNSSRKEFAISQFESGLLLQEKGKYAEAEQAYKSIQREDGKKLFVLSRCYLGEILGLQEKYAEAEHVYKAIQREDNKKLFALSRFNLGVLLGIQEKYSEAEQSYREIEISDDKEQFIESRVNLGVVLEKQEKYAEAEQVYKAVKREDDKKQFAMARFNLGLLFDKQEKYQEAKQAYREIEREDDKQLFAKSRVNLGVVLEKQEKYAEAKQVYKEIKREDDKKQFAMARLNLGLLFDKQEKYQEAKQAYREIKREDDKQLFAKSRINLAALLKIQKKYEEAKSVYQEVKREDDKVQFTMARYHLGLLLDEQGKYDEAEKAFRDIVRSDNPEDFAFICITFALLLKKYNKLDDVKKVLKNIIEDDGEYFFIASFIIGEIYLHLGDYENAIISFMNSKKIYYYESECFIRILEASNKIIIRDLINLKNATAEILNYLRLDAEYEEHICHYTRPNIAFLLLGGDKDDEKPSKLRLNTIKNVNDPTEGKVLFDYFNLPNREIEPSSFISCFTFNHDSLNQFRLYGKENNQEASGVSIVFKKDFFGGYSRFFNFIEYGLRESPINNLSSSEDILSINENVNVIDGSKITKLPVYRCIYIDVESGYIKLAKCNEINFYSKGLSEHFNAYLKVIKNKELGVKRNLNKINVILSRIINNKYFYNGVFDVINYILLPLKFLVKHSAFEDEQECRMFFITNVFDERIISNVKERSMYLEYEPSVRENIKEIYLSIGAYQYEDFFIRSLRDSSKVCRSRNPFRNK